MYDAKWECKKIYYQNWVGILFYYDISERSFGASGIRSLTRLIPGALSRRLPSP